MAVVDHVSDTARWVAAYRAMESERKDALFRDPFARTLAGDVGFAIARSLPGGMKSAASAVVARTCAFDALIAKAIHRGADAVVNLAAGLDARPWRLDVPVSLEWFEIDLPGILAHKQRTLGPIAPHCRLTQVAQDLTDVGARRALFARIAAEHRRVLVCSEGLLPYLDAAAVESLARDLHAEPAFEWWLVDFLSPRIVEYMKKTWGKTLQGGAQIKFAPPDGLDFFARLGFRADEVRWLMDDAARLHREPPSGKVMRLVLSLVGSKRREEFKKKHLPGTVLLAREADA
jgi:methyltransferase (TIGR00027 family)